MQNCNSRAAPSGALFFYGMPEDAYSTRVCRHARLGAAWDMRAGAAGFKSTIGGTQKNKLTTNYSQITMHLLVNSPLS
jgi:hypothetical protein